MLRPTAIKVEPLDDYRLLLTFDNNEKKLFDVLPLFERKPFEKLKNKTLFKNVHTNGITVEWFGEIDICPDELYYNSTAIS